MALNVTAGTPATAQAFNALVPVYLVQGSDQALATTTYTNHSTFAALAVAVGEVWEVDVVLQHDSADAGNDIKVQWTTTGGCAFLTRRLISSPGLTATSAVDVAGNFQMRAGSSSVSGGSTTSATNAACWVERFLITASGSAGTYTMQWGQNAATSGSTTVRAGSFLIARRLA